MNFCDFLARLSLLGTEGVKGGWGMGAWWTSSYGLLKEKGPSGTDGHLKGNRGGGGGRGEKIDSSKGVISCFREKYLTCELW